jgi:DNA transposition AAA+ family ATPase
MHMVEFAQKVNSNKNTLYKIYTGKYRYPDTHAKAGQIIHPTEKLIKSVEDFLSLAKKRFLAGNTALVITPTLQSIVKLCDLARESQTICVLVGPSHIGKTWSLERCYTPNNNHGRTIYVRMDAASGLGGMVRVLAVALGISPKGNTADLIHRIENAITSDMLIILDEMSLLAHTYRLGSFFNCIEVLRQIHDKKKCGMVWCFTQIKNFMDHRDKELQQAWRRGVHKLTLPDMPTVGDLTAILEHNGLDFPSKEMKVEVHFKDGEGKRQSITERPYELLRQIAKDEGLLAVTERIRYALKLAKKAGKQIDWPSFITAHLLIAKQAKPSTDWN